MKRFKLWTLGSEVASPPREAQESQPPPPQFVQAPHQIYSDVKGPQRDLFGETRIPPLDHPLNGSAFSRKGEVAGYGDRIDPKGDNSVRWC